MRVEGDDNVVSWLWVHSASHSRNRKVIGSFEGSALFEEANPKLVSVSVKDFFSSQTTVGANVAIP